MHCSILNSFSVTWSIGSGCGRIIVKYFGSFLSSSIFAPVKIKNFSVKIILLKNTSWTVSSTSKLFQCTVREEPFVSKVHSPLAANCCTSCQKKCIVCFLYASPTMKSTTCCVQLNLPPLLLSSILAPASNPPCSVSKKVPTLRLGITDACATRISSSVGGAVTTLCLYLVFILDACATRMSSSVGGAVTTLCWYVDIITDAAARRVSITDAAARRVSITDAAAPRVPSTTWRNSSSVGGAFPWNVQHK